MSGAPLLAVEGLVMRFGGVHALDGFDFTLGQGELRCLIGPNGAGKSTFFKCLTGQLKPTAGSIRLHGREIAGQRTAAIMRAGIGIKTQVPAVFDSLSVRESLWVAARRRLSGRRLRAAIADMLARLGIEALAGALVGTLGHGQRQMVELAMVLIQGPALILLDEPTAGMSEDEVALVAALVRELARDHALVVVEHDMRFIARLAGTVTVMHRGRMLVEDSVERVLGNARVREVYLGGGDA